MPEVLVAIAMAGMMIAALYGGLTSSTLHMTVAREDLRATQILMEKMEIIRSYTWNQFFPNIDPDESDEDDGETFDIEDPDYAEDDIPFSIPSGFIEPFVPGGSTNSGLVYHGTIQIVPASITEAYSNSLAQVVIGVTWGSANTTHQRQLRSFFAEHGMQNNITR